MTALKIAETLRGAFAAIDELDDPNEVDVIVAAIVGHLRQLRPEQFGCLSILPPPTDPICDPRKAGGS